MAKISAEELVGEELAEWYSLTPTERWRQSTKLWETYLSLGGSLDPESDTQSPFFDRDGSDSPCKKHGLKVISTTRNPDKVELLKEHGVDDVIIDDGTIAAKVGENSPNGVDRVLELIGTATLRDSLKCAAPGGVVCMTGILGNAWTLNEFTPMGDIPHTVRLTVYTGEARDLSANLLQEFVDGVASGKNHIKIDRTFTIDEIVEAHRYMESNQASGKLVVLV